MGLYILAMTKLQETAIYLRNKNNSLEQRIQSVNTLIFPMLIAVVKVGPMRYELVRHNKQLL